MLRLQGKIRYSGHIPTITIGELLVLERIDCIQYMWDVKKKMGELSMHEIFLHFSMYGKMILYSRGFLLRVSKIEYNQIQWPVGQEKLMCSIVNLLKIISKLFTFSNYKSFQPTSWPAKSQQLKTSLSSGAGRLSSVYLGSTSQSQMSIPSVDIFILPILHK